MFKFTDQKTLLIHIALQLIINASRNPVIPNVFFFSMFEVYKRIGAIPGLELVDTQSDEGSLKGTNSLTINAPNRKENMSQVGA